MITLSRSHCQEALTLVAWCDLSSLKGEISLSENPPAAVPRRPTMLDVAALAGVGLKTVSRVVNDEPGGSPALEAKVRAGIAQLNYRPDPNTSMLRRPGGQTQRNRLCLEGRAKPLSSALP